MQNSIYLYIMSISEIIMLILLYLINSRKNKTQVKFTFSALIVCLFIWTFSLSLQILYQKQDIDPFFFEKLAGFGAFFTPVILLLFSQVYVHTKVNFTKKYLLLFIVPIISLILAFTNEFHHLFVINYALSSKDIIWGPYFTVHSIYSYLCLFVALFSLIRYSVKISGFFSKQSILIVVGTLIPLVTNIISTYSKDLNLSVYVSPISFTFAMFFFAIAIFKFQFLKVSPIALQKVVDRMSDGYLVLNDDNIIIDFNKSFIENSGFSAVNIRNKNIFELNDREKFPIENDRLEKAINHVKSNSKTVSFEKHITSSNKYYNIEISSIIDNNNFLGTLILFKDITQHMIDLQTIKDNQDLLVEKERLASLGQMIGGIAHNLKTPIMSIAGAAEGLLDLIKEYDNSIEDPNVTVQDHHDIAKDMSEWIDKIKAHTSYMSDVITAVKGQAVAFSENQMEVFTVEELMKRVNILMKHELKNALIELNFCIHVNTDLELHGNINSLVQVINNMISNAIQCYEGKKNQSIDLIVEKTDNDIIISIRDYGPGLSDVVKDKLFKEMITTKGKNGTGLGLFMSYSNIRAHFNGNITVDSEPGKGTTFHIILPL